MITIHFSGIFQCRLATDPDPSDDPRGRSGGTLAVAGEPDLDRVIRFQNFVSLRWPYVSGGVYVDRVVQPGWPNNQAHPLLGARVDLLNNAKFEGRNFIIAGTGREPIDPFTLQIQGGGITITRTDLWDPMNPNLSILQVSPDVMSRRQPTFKIMDPQVMEAAGVSSPPAFRAKRLADLKQYLPNVTDPVQRAALLQRITALEKDGAAFPGITSFIQVVLTVKEIFEFDINGPGTIDDPNGVLGAASTLPNWPIHFWMGGYDCDTLIGHIGGHLRIPVINPPP